MAMVLSLLLVASPAHGDRVRKSDGDDTRSPLDIARIVAKHRSGHSNIFIHKVRMHDRWKSSLLESGHKATRSITLTFDVRRNVGYSCTGCITEREVMIIFRDGKLHATLYNHLGDPPKKLRSLPVWRPNKRTVAFAVTRKQLRSSRYSSYDWGVMALFEKRGFQGCRPGRGCSDLVPNDRDKLVTHQL